jgi:hypothetical protein
MRRAYNSVLKLPSSVLPAMRAPPGRIASAPVDFTRDARSFITAGA